MAAPQAYAHAYDPLVYSAHRESAVKRFWKAFFVALLVWFLASALIRSIVDLAHPGRHRGGWVSDCALLDSIHHMLTWSFH